MSLKMTIRWCSVMAVVIVMLMEIEMGSALDMGQYQGCYDTSNNLYARMYGGQQSSVDDCAKRCRALNTAFAGIEAGTKCWCSNLINSLALTSLNCYTDKAIRCPADNNTICGGVDAMSIYRVCPIGKKGINCDIDCSNCGNKGCPIGGGGCLDSCDAGFYSDQYLHDNCPYPCSLNRYGLSCRFNCPVGCKNATCDNRDGRCIDGCTDTSKRGPYCTDTCVPGKHGQNCDQDCPSECRYACNSATGACDQCAVQGKYGTDCDIDCPDGCARACDKSTGNCVACKAGRIWNRCDQCVEGMYGNDCDISCPDGCEGACDKSTGNCAACVAGRYSVRCEMTCSEGCRDGQCNKESGSCSCISGWTGDYCNSCISHCATCNSTGCTSCVGNLYHGGTCENQCSRHCLNGCRKSDGYCYGCQNNRYRAQCDLTCHNRCVCEQWGRNPCTTCVPGSWGALYWMSYSCKNSCSNGCQSGTCRKADGYCSPCKTNWAGSKCENCINGHWGISCDSQCSSGCQGVTCAKNDGGCPCRNNWAGTKCDICVNGMYGPDCEYTCGKGCLAGICTKSDGKCKCKTYWAGNMCDRCANGQYGPDCQDTCSSGCKSGTCTKSDGSCSPCKPNWTGDKCERCVEGKYGSDCMSECSEGCNGTICVKASGSCMCKQEWHGQRCDSECEGNCLNGCDQRTAVCNGCVDGKHGERCNVSCSSSCDPFKCEQFSGGCSCKVGSYGVACDKECSKKCLEKTCDKTDGKCTIGCVNDYWSPFCTEICPENCKGYTCDRTSGECSLGCDNTYWSSECNQTCPDNCKDGTCNQITSHCSKAGCKDDFYGETCNLTCSPTCATGVCDRESGVCLGCRDGFYGGYCKQTCTGNCLGNRCQQNADATICSSGCEDGFHGVSCEETCPDNCLDNKCKQTRGICQQCIPGKQGDKCDAKCVSLAFGPGCNGTCHCADEVSCDPESGACPAGLCASGFEGSSCQESVPPGPPGYVAAVISIIAGAVVVVLIVFGIVFFVRRYRRAHVSKPPNTLDDNPGEDAIPLHAVNNNGYTDIGNTAGDVEASLDAGKATATKPPVKKKPTVPVKPRLNNDYSSVPLTLDQVAPHIKASEHNNALTLEFESLPMKQQAAWDVAMEQPKERNRFKNIMPYDDNRVKLQVPEGSDSTDYINASYIPGIFNTKDEYIASQGPTTHILADFIRMIWELKINTIVMVTSLEEKGTVKCTRYWPDGVGKSRTHCGINVTLMEEVIKMGRAERTMVFNQGSDNLTVTQLHYTSWPDHGVPPSATVLLDIRRTLREMHHTSPILVHCSAGVGRTGTFIALDMLLSGAEINGTVNVPAMVKTLRASRVNMVQTQNQYDFLYKAVYEGLHMGPTLFTLNELKDFMAEDDFGDDLAKQFNILEEFRPVIAPQNLLAAHLPANVDKNRFPEILPASRDRVILMTKVDERTDYINAVNVNGPNQQSQFVATQVPLTDTIVDMWRMVMDYKISVVVYLKNPNNKVQKTPRWIPTSSSPLRLPCCNVHLEKKDEGGDVRHVVVTAGQGPSQEDQEPGLYGNVNARGRPLMDMDPGAAGAEESEYMNVGAAANATAPPTRYEVAVLTVSMDSPGTLIDAVKRMNDMEPDPTKSRAIVCWNGVAECGVFIATHWLLDMADKYEEVDIYDTVFRIRAHRPFFIENVEQYKFLYEIAEEIANRKTL